MELGTWSMYFESSIDLCIYVCPIIVLYPFFEFVNFDAVIIGYLVYFVN
jgi:hypothetical protein